MIKAIFLIFESGATWDRIAQAQRSFAAILTTYLLPMVLLTTVVESWGLQRWGKWQPKFHLVRSFSLNTVIVFEVIQVLMLLAMVFVSALLLLRISQTFHSRGTYLQAFTTTAYAFSPLFLTHLLDAGPMINPWVCWGLGIGLSIWVLYQGIPRVMQPDPTHAFGLYLSMMFVMVLTSGIVRALTGLYLLGYVDFQNSWLTHKFPGLL
jgi:hypothetical protein